MIELVGIINIGINPVLIDTGGFELTWHGLFTALSASQRACGWQCVWRVGRRFPRTMRCRSPWCRCCRGSSALGCSG